MNGSDFGIADPIEAPKRGVLRAKVNKKTIRCAGRSREFASGFGLCWASDWYRRNYTFARAGNKSHPGFRLDQCASLDVDFASGVSAS